MADSLDTRLSLGGPVGPGFGPFAANAPLIVNAFPPRGVWGFSPYWPWRLGFRDRSTRADLSDLWVGMGFGKAFFPSPVDTDGAGTYYLPEEVHRLTDPEGAVSSFFGGFSDTGTVGPVGSVDDGEVFRQATANGLWLEKTTGTPAAPTYQEGVQYVSDEVDPDDSVMAEAITAVVIPDSFQANYTTFTNFAGAVGGFVYGPTGQALILFLCVDSVGPNFQFTVRVCSPATDGSGTRVEHAVVPLNTHAFPTENFAFKVFWDVDDAVARILIPVIDDAGDTVDMNYVSVNTAAVGTVLPGVTFGGMTFDTAFFEGAAFVGLDASTLGTTMNVEMVALSHVAGMLFEDGVPVPGTYFRRGSSSLAECRGDRLTTDSFAASSEGWDWVLDAWLPDDVTFEGVTLEGSEIVISSVDSPGITPVLRHEVPFRDACLGWHLELKFSLEDTEHPNAYNTGFGVRFGYKDRLILLVAYYDYAQHDLAIYTPTPVTQASYDYVMGANYTTLGVDWFEATVHIHLVFDAAASRLYAYDNNWALLATINEADLPQPPSAPDEVLELGQIMSGTDVLSAVGLLDDFVGSLSLSHARMKTDCLSYDSWSGLPAAAWTLSALGTGTTAVVDGLLVIDDTDYGPVSGPEEGYRVYSAAHDNLIPSIGGAVEAALLVDDWTDNIGTPMPASKSVSAGVGIFDGADAAMLRFVDTGYTKYVYVPTSDADASLTAVLSQSSVGQTLSAPVDYTTEHTYLLVMNPGRSIRVYIDGAQTPAIEVPWTAAGFDLPGEPVTLPSPCAFFGSYDARRAARVSVRNVRFSVGSGYDLVVGRKVDDDTVDGVYDSYANVVVKVKDKD